MVWFWFQRPKSHGKKRREEPRHLQKPDLDNLAKAVLDSLNGLAWVDDSQIYRLLVEKVWVDEQPRTVVTLKFS
jgi:Holliday junction resolvase RusA-like endonuclease